MIVISNKKIKELKLKYQESLDNIKTKEDLKSLLDTAIKFNKYPFDNIVLIHNQNPNAEFLATINIWNNNVGRQINKGTKDLAVLEIDNPNPTYRHLFELKNTNGSYSSYNKVLSYKLEVKEDEKDLLTQNINKNSDEKYKDLKEFLYNKFTNQISSKYESYFENIDITEEQMLEATEFALYMCEYMLLKKCNYEIDLSNDINLDSIKDIKVFSKVGSLATDIARDILKEVFYQVKRLEKEKERKGELQNGREIVDYCQ